MEVLRRMDYLIERVFSRDRPIMLIILPIMLCCSAHKIYLLCSRIRIVLSLLSLFIIIQNLICMNKPLLIYQII